MKRVLTVISADNNRNAFKDVVDGINAEFKDRNLIGNLDGMDASWDVCFMDAVSKLGGEYDVTRTNDGDEYFVALDGAPLSAVMGT